MQQTKVYIIIVTYNGMLWIDSCLQSLRESNLHVKTIIVDNCSADETVVHIANEYKEVTLIPLKNNVGFGQANNIGIRKAYDEGAEYVYLLNQDAWLMTNTIEQLVEIMKNDPKIGITSPMQMDASMKKVDKLFLKDILTSAETTQEMLSGFITGDLKNNYGLWYFPAAHWMLSRRCIEEVGLFSPAFFHYGEDNNYIERVHFHGLKTAVAPNVYAVHDRGERKKLDFIGLAFLQYNKAIIQASNIELDSLMHFIYLVKFYLISIVYFLFTRTLHLFKKVKKHYLEMTPFSVVNKCYRFSKQKGFMLNVLYEKTDY